MIFMRPFSGFVPVACQIAYRQPLPGRPQPYLSRPSRVPGSVRLAESSISCYTVVHGSPNQCPVPGIS
jgi:hypothetical protein